MSCAREGQPLRTFSCSLTINDLTCVRPIVGPVHWLSHHVTAKSLLLSFPPACSTVPPATPDIVVDNCAICRNHIMDLCTWLFSTASPPLPLLLPLIDNCAVYCWMVQ